MATRSASRPPGTQLVALRLSLNTPVVVIEQLPTGPAAAGIAVHRGAGGSRLTVALRAVRGGQVAFFEPDECGLELDDAAASVDAAVAFAERLGFLFDDDPIEAGGDVQGAARGWAELVAGSAAAVEEPELWPAQPPVLTKFRFPASVPREARLATAPPAPQRAGSNLWLRLLSRF